MSHSRIAFLERQNAMLTQEVIEHCNAVDRLAAELHEVKNLLAAYQSVEEAPAIASAETPQA